MHDSLKTIKDAVINTKQDFLPLPIEEYIYNNMLSISIDKYKRTIPDLVCPSRNLHFLKVIFETCIYKQYRFCIDASASEMDVTEGFADLIHDVIRVTQKQLSCNLKSFKNQSHRGADTETRSIKKRHRPDAFWLLNNRIVLICEYKRSDDMIDLAIQDLNNKKSELSNYHYANIPFIFGIAGAGNTVKLLVRKLESDDNFVELFSNSINTEVRKITNGDS